MTLFRPCIDLHQGRVKQIVGGTLGPDEGPVTNFVSEEPARAFAQRYASDGLLGGHVIQLGPGNEAASKEALAAYPGGLQLGGGVSPSNADLWLQRGAAKVIITSWLFADGALSAERLAELRERIPAERLVIDLSCRRREEGWWVATDRWQTVTQVRVDPETLNRLAPYCSEFLVHAADVEGLCQGIDEELVAALGEWSPLPCTYAGGGRSLDDLERVADLSRGRIDLTFGSALDIFGGRGVKYADCVAFNRAQFDPGR